MSITTLAAVTAINDATMIISTLAPLLERAMQNGETVISDEDVDAARARALGALDSLDAAIEKARTAGPT